MPATTAKLLIAVAQPLVIPGDVAENIRRMKPLVAEAARRGAGLVLFSEAGLTGCDFKNAGLHAALSLDDPRLDQVEALSRSHRVAIVAGFYERHEGALFNAAVAFLPDGQRVVQRKHNIVGHEKEHTPVRPGGRKRILFQVGGLRLGILVCADAGLRHIFAELASEGCDAVLIATAGCGNTKHGFHQRELSDPRRRAHYLKAAQSVCFVRGSVEQALRWKIGVAACNQSGWVAEAGYFHPGHSSVVNRTGEITALIPGCFVFEQLRPQLAVGVVEVAKGNVCQPSKR